MAASSPAPSKPSNANSWTVSTTAEGKYVRKDSSFRYAVSAAAGADFPAASGRYHLYVSLACPWAHRTLITRAFKGLQKQISFTVVDPYLTPTGWHFSDDEAIGTAPDPANGFKLVREVYELADPAYASNYTVPILFDLEKNTIVNNESSEIIRQLNTEFNALAENPAVDLYPEPLREAIDEVNAWVYPNINNGVYKCGFATTQKAYEEAFEALFEHLDRADEILGRQRFLVGNQLTEADVRLFTTLVRFDAVYVAHFKTNLKRIVDFKNLWDYVRDIYQLPGIAETCDMYHIKNHYFRSHLNINPKQIVPKGPDLDFLAPTARAEQFGDGPVFHTA